MHHPTDRIAHTTAFVTPVVEHWLERKIAQWVHPMKDRSDDPSHHERTLLPRSYISPVGINLRFKKCNLASRCQASCVAVVAAISFMLKRDRQYIKPKGTYIVKKIIQDSYELASKCLQTDKEVRYVEWFLINNTHWSTSAFIYLILLLMVILVTENK